MLYSVIAILLSLNLLTLSIAFNRLLNHQIKLNPNKISNIPNTKNKNVIIM